MNSNTNSNITYNLKTDVFYASFFFITCSLFSLFLINLSRLGLDVPANLNILIITIILNLGLSPYLFSFDNNIGYIHTCLKISLSILLSFLLIFLGFISPYIYYFFATVFIFISIYKIKKLIRKINFKLLLTLLIFSLFFVVNYIPWKIEYFYSPEITIFGLGGNQTMQGAALTNIFKNFKVFSLGADGTENFLYKYHYGLYAWWASISSISKTNSLFVIPFTQQAVLMPMIFFSTYISSLSFLKNSSRINLLFLTIFFFVLFDIFSGKLHYDSETYTSSLIFLILTLPLIKYVLENKKNDIFISVLLIILIPIISSLKLTTGYLFCILIGTTFFYKRNYFINYIFIFLVFSFGMISVNLFMPSGYTEQSLWRVYSSLGQLFIYENFFCIILPLLYLLNLFFKIKFKPIISFKKRLNKNFIKKIIRWLFNKQLSFQKISIIAFVGSILPIFIIPVGATAVYNIIHSHWLFLILTLSFLINDKVLNISISKLFLTSLVLISFVLFLKPVNIKHNILQSFFEKTLDKDISGPGELKNILISNIKNEKKFFNDLQLKNINQNSLSKILNQARNYEKIYNNDFAIYIPKKNLLFWEIMKNNDLPYWCSSTTFLIPALTGIQMVKGIQDPSLCKTYFVAGPSEYPKSSYLDNLSNFKLCNHAKTKKINNIFRINDILNTDNNEMVECK